MTANDQLCEIGLIALAVIGQHPTRERLFHLDWFHLDWHLDWPDPERPQSEPAVPA